MSRCLEGKGGGWLSRGLNPFCPTGQHVWGKEGIKERQMQREMLPDSFGSAYQSIIISHDVHIALQYNL